MYTEFMYDNILHAFSRPARKNATNRNLLRQSFIAYIFRSKKQEPEQESKSSIAYIFRSQSAREQEPEQECKSFIAYIQEQEAREQELYCLHL